MADEMLDTEDLNSNTFANIAERYKAGEELSDSDVDQIVDLAITILRDLLSFFDADSAPIDEFTGDDGEIILDITGPNLAVLIGRHGYTLESFQTIFSLLLSRKLGFRFPISIDLEGYKARRRDKIISMAERAAERCLRQQSPVALSPMTPYERRLVHIALRENPSVETHSEGVDAQRHVIVTPIVY